MADWISTDEAGFEKQAKQYAGVVAANPAALGVSTDKNTALQTKLAAFLTRRAARDAYEQQGAPIYQGLRDAREALTGELRTLDGEILGRRETTNDQRAALGRAVPDTVLTAAAKPASRPVILKVVADQRLTHIIHWVDEHTPGSKAKPAGVKRAILFRKVGGAAPVSVEEMEEVAGDSATPYLCEFDAADAGKPCHWGICWENSAGERGPLSVISTWTIPG